MKNLLHSAAQLTSRGVLAAVASVALLAALPAAAGIANTKHNLSSGATKSENKSSTTDEICVFCHTPHAADTTAPVPLWNKGLRTDVTGYTTYKTLNSGSIDGEMLSVGSVSLACLSCHDGTQAMDNIINAPGSGGYTSGGGGANGLGWAWTGTRVDTTTGKLINTASTLAMLSEDLSNDHPIGIAYCGGGPKEGAATAACKDADFVAPKNDTINTNLVWWVDTTAGTDGTREKTDMILYSRKFADNKLGPSVECGSCHDPHVEEYDATTNASSKAGKTFLRISNAGSDVCLACHTK